MSNTLSSMHLWYLISPTLPVGAFCYSQGLEYAVEAGWVKDELSAADWVHGQLSWNLCWLDLPVFLRCYDAWQDDAYERVAYWNNFLLASRESGELYQQDITLGTSLQRLLESQGIVLPTTETETWSFVSVYAYACHYWNIPREDAARGLLWGWCENQVAAAIKLVPLGQTSGQRILLDAIDPITDAVEKAYGIDDEQIGQSAPGLAIGSALHEVQYTRLFRS